MRRPRRAAAVNLWVPPPIFDDWRTDNLSAHRRSHVGVFNYFIAFLSFE